MSKDLDDVLLELAKRDRIAEVFMSLGATHEQADIAANTPRVAKEFQWTGALLTFQKQAMMKHDDGKLVKDWLTANKFDFLLPAPTPDPDSIKSLNIDPALLASARAGNKTAGAKLFVAVGRDHDKLAAVLADTGNTDAENKTGAPGKGADDKSGTDHATNPFSKAGWNIQKQGALFRAVGAEKCAQIAASVGSKIGATKPNPLF
jgi:hypothetical protein